MELTDIQIMKTYLQKMVEIRTGLTDEDGEEVRTTRIDYPCFAVVRNPLGAFKDIDAELAKHAEKLRKQGKAEATIKEQVEEKRAEILNR